jgi:hypothetical protein
MHNCTISQTACPIPERARVVVRCWLCKSQMSTEKPIRVIFGRTRAPPINYCTYAQGACVFKLFTARCVRGEGLWKDVGGIPSLEGQCSSERLFSNIFVQYTARIIPFMYFFRGIARPQFQFPHLCVCERFIYSQDWSTYFLQQIGLGNT